MKWKKLNPAFFATLVAPGSVLATRTVTALALVAVFALASCAQPQKPADVESSVIGVALRFQGVAERIDDVYFVRLGGTDRVRGHFPRLRSNFRQGNRFYLLNVPPGRYAAVAASKMDPGTVVCARIGVSPNTFFTAYFHEPMIRKTIVEVKPGKFAFMGTYSVRKEFDFYAGDETQALYRSLIEPTLDPNQPDGAVPDLNSFSYGAFLLTADREARTEAIFLNAALEDLEKSGWESLLRKRLETLPPK
ncbi:MAG: hypothetical protein IIA14_16100 [SAR324 cluster bacterium]|nr:hypothetical protein [SAR324 cluster bacterium]